MKKYKHHKYTWFNPFGNPKHRWELVGPRGAVHFDATAIDHKVICGLEFHYTDGSRPDKNAAPDHVDCPLTGGRCWHDGTSLYAQERVWPLIEPYLKYGEHEKIFEILEHEADIRFKTTDIEGD